MLFLYYSHFKYGCAKFEKKFRRQKVNVHRCMVINYVKYILMCVCVCVCVCTECSFAILLQSLYHGINLTEGSVTKYFTATVLHERTVLFLW